MIRKPFVRSPYNYDMDEVSEETGLLCLDKSLTVQSALEETDINNIVRRFGLTGQLPENLRVPQYEDFDAIYDYHSAMNMVVEARNAFMQLSGAVRARFDNDPDKLMAFVADPKNLDEARALGIAVPAPAAVEIPLVRIVPADQPGGSGHAGHASAAPVGYPEPAR